MDGFVRREMMGNKGMWRILYFGMMIFTNMGFWGTEDRLFTLMTVVLFVGLSIVETIREVG